MTDGRRRREGGFALAAAVILLGVMAALLALTLALMNRALETGDRARHARQRQSLLDGSVARARRLLKSKEAPRVSAGAVVPEEGSAAVGAAWSLRRGADGTALLVAAAVSRSAPPRSCRVTFRRLGEGRWVVTSYVEETGDATGLLGDPAAGSDDT
jgi:hypothetical protein